MNPDDDLENRLRAVRPPTPPWELVLRLRDAEPASPRGAWRRLPECFRVAWHPWRLAYAGLLAAWVLIAVLRLLTLPLLPRAADVPSLAAQERQPPAPTGRADPLERTFLVTRNHSQDPLWQ